jgi:methylglutaconyl-CoA hydratase
MDDAAISIEIDAQGTAWVTLDRPRVHNAFDDNLIAEMTDALRRIGDDPGVRAVAIAARGTSFSAGADLNWMKRAAAASHAENVADALRLAELLRLLCELPKPTVALVQGPAYGGGVGLIAACDIAIAAEETAAFALTEVRLGLVPATISPYVIAAIGRRQAQRYFLTAERFGAADALRIGLVHVVVPGAALRAAAARMFDALGQGGAGALSAAKELIRSVAGRAIDADLMAETAERIASARASNEARERISAFLERRV